MKKSFMTLAMVFCLALTALPTLADSLVLTVTADTTFAGNSGHIVNEVFVEDGYPPEVVDFAAFTEAGKLRIYGFRPWGEEWQILPTTTYIVQQASLSIGDSWAGFPDDNFGSTTATVEAVESVTVPAGVFNNAYRVDTRIDAHGPDSQPRESHWWVAGVGFVLNIGYDDGGSVEYTTQLVSFIGSGSDFFPMNLGNVWIYEETPGGISAAHDDAIPAKASLVGAYPNPFNPQTQIVFEMAVPGDVQLQIYDSAGRLVTTLVNEHRESGRHEVLWNGRDQSGRMASAGVYLYRLETLGTSTTKRVTLIK